MKTSPPIAPVNPSSHSSPPSVTCSVEPSPSNTSNGPPPDGKGTAALGPYYKFYKFQVWQDGHNHTRSVSADEFDILREGIANHHLFQQIFHQPADRLIAETRQLRASRRERTRHGRFRAQGYFIGSGVIEAG